MKTYPIAQILILLFFFSLETLQAQRYELIWADEFNEAQVNSDAWRFWNGTAYNNELQYYTPRSQNIRTENGNLVLEAHKENYNGRFYTSGRMSTQNAHFWKYGIVQARIKLPKGRGFWPAFWMMPQYAVYGGWPHSGEIDIMEFRGNRLNEHLSTIHFARNLSRASIGKTTELGIDLSEEFHVFGMEWNQNGFIFTLDSIPHFQINREQVVADNYPFDESFYMILNLAVGGDFLDNPDANTPFPTSMLVDWVRVYQDVNKLPYRTTETNEFNIKSTNRDKIYFPAKDDDGRVDSVIIEIPDQYYSQTVAYTDSLALPFLPKGKYGVKLRFIDNNSAWSETYSIDVISDSGWEYQHSFLDEKPEFFTDFPVAYFDIGGLGVSYDSPHPHVFYENEIQSSSPFKIQATENNYEIGPLKFGAWMEYSFEMQDDCECYLEIQTKTEITNSRFSVYLDNEWLTQFARIAPSDTFKTLLKGPFLFTKGNHILNIQADSDSLSFGVMNTFSEALAMDDKTGNPSQFKILGAFPNPFNPTTEIQMEVPKAGQLSFWVTDVLGRIVVPEQFHSVASGKQTFLINLSKQSSGVYWVRMQFEEMTQTVPITLIK